MKKMVSNFLLLLTLSAVLGEKPIRGRPFSQPLFLRQEEAPAQAPYQPSGWKPQGQRLVLPSRQESGVPHTVYGPPSSEAPPSEYGPPDAGEPESTEVPYPPNNEYGPPETPQEPNNAYGPPDQSQPEPLEPQQPEPYPPASGPPGETDASNGGYDYPPPEQPFPDPNNQYGPPEQQPQQPDNEYGPPQAQQPGNEYGAPPQPDNGYGPPPQENGQIPVDQGASERIRQRQFIQQLPGFEPSRFQKPQSQRFRQQPRGNQPQKLQQLPQRSQKQQFRQQPNRRPVNPVNQQQFQKQRVQPQQQTRQRQSQRQNIAPAQNQQFAQKQQLYQTPQTAAETPNVAIATAVSGEYYVVEPHGRLQRVSYTTKNGKLVDGKITNGIKPEEVRNTISPIYQVNEFNQLVRVQLTSF